MSDVNAGTATDPRQALYCPRCGGEVADGDHPACRAALVLEPPRYCASCKRRMVVQVSPSGWHATCSRHGRISQ